MVVSNLCRPRKPQGTPCLHAEGPRLVPYPPALLRVLGISAVFLCISPLISGQDLDFTWVVGACISLLSVVVLFPLSLKTRTPQGMAPFPATPFVVLNFLYFVAASLAPLLYPRAYYGTISFSAMPVALLVLSLGFLCFDVGVLISGAVPSKPRRRTSGFGRISNLGVLTLISVVTLWTTRVVLAGRGFGITHAPNMVSVDRSVSEMSVLVLSLAYIPLSFALARICSGLSTTHEQRRWKKYFWCIFLTDVLYYTLAGSRQGLVWEFLITVWVCWLRDVPVLHRRSAPILCVILLPLLAAVYAQRSALETAQPRLGESHLKLTHDYISIAERSILAGAFWSAVSAGLDSDAGRLTAVGPFSGVAQKAVDDQYPLMWGETLAAELPLLVPHAVWPTKPIGEKIDYIINRHFDLFSLDELCTSETELLANFGILGLCAGLLLFGILTERLCASLVPGAPVSESTLFFVLGAMPFVFHVETDITTVLMGLRLLVPLWIVVHLFEHKVRLQRTAE